MRRSFSTNGLRFGDAPAETERDIISIWGFYNNSCLCFVENTSSNESRFNSLSAKWEMLAVRVALCVWSGGVVWGIARFVQGMQAAAFLAQGVQAWEGLAEIEATNNLSSLSGTPAPPVFISTTLWNSIGKPSELLWTIAF